MKRIYQSTAPYIVVRKDWWKRYGDNAFIEIQQQCGTLREAEYVKNSFERQEGKEYIIIENREGEE